MLTRLLHIAGIILCVTFLLGANQCQTSTTNGTGSDGPVFVTTLAVEDANGNSVSTFLSTTNIQFVLGIRNRSTSNQTIAFSMGQQYNFEVLQSGTATEVWTWALDQSQPFSQNSSSLTIKAGQTQTFSVIWNQLDDNGQQVLAGSYEVIGGLTCTNSSSSSSSASIACMPTGISTSDQLAPSVFISTLVPFTIQ